MKVRMCGVYGNKVATVIRRIGNDLIEVSFDGKTIIVSWNFVTIL